MPHDADVIDLATARAGRSTSPTRLARDQIQLNLAGIARCRAVLRDGRPDEKSSSEEAGRGA